MENSTCAKCGMLADGYKCDVCGAEAKEHDENHNCEAGGTGANCVVKCSGCAKTQTQCSC